VIAQSTVVIARESGRSSIPEKLVIESRGRSILDTPLSRGMTAVAVVRGAPYLQTQIF
jgi:hypothetical protein